MLPKISVVSDSDGVSPVISVVLLIAIVVSLGALGSAYFFDVGENSDSSLPSDVSLKNNVGNGYLNTTLLKGNPDAVYILKNGTTEKTANSPVVGDSYSIQASQGSTLAVVVQVDGSNTTVFHTTVSTGSTVSNNNIGTLTWSTSSDWDSATTNDVLHSSDTVNMTYFEDFEDGNLGKLEKRANKNSQISVTSNDVISGSYSMRVYSENNNAGEYAYLNKSWDNVSVAADMKRHSSIDTDLLGVVSRANLSNGGDETQYQLIFDGNTKLKKNSGGFTTLDSTSKGGYGVNRYKIVADGDSLKGYINGNQEVSATDSDIDAGEMGVHAFELEARYDNLTIRSLDGTVETSSKSFSSSIKPDIKNLSYSLNGGSINVTVIGSPGTASEEKQTVQLDGSSSYSLSWTESHKKFKIKIEMDGTDSGTPTFSSIEIG